MGNREPGKLPFQFVFKAHFHTPAGQKVNSTSVCHEIHPGGALGWKKRRQIRCQTLFGAVVSAETPRLNAAPMAPNAGLPVARCFPARRDSLFVECASLPIFSWCSQVIASMLRKRSPARIQPAFTAGLAKNKRAYILPYDRLWCSE